MKKLLCLLPIIILCAGCAQTDVAPPIPKTDPAAVKLAEAASEVSSSLETLEAIRKSEAGNYMKKLPNPNIHGMTQEVSIDWTGPLQPLMERLAQMGNYKLQILGNAPTIPVIVSMDSQDTTLGEIIRNADYQAGDKANIVIYPNSKIIEIRYTYS